MAKTKIPALSGAVIEPTKDLLTGIGLLGDHTAICGANRDKTPYSLQVIESGALGITKVWGSIVGAAGGLTALGALFAGFWGGQSPGEKMVLYGASAVFLAATAISISIIVRSDVMARGQSAAAKNAARGAVAVAMIGATCQCAGSCQHPTVCHCDKATAATPAQANEPPAPAPVTAAAGDASA